MHLTRTETQLGSVLGAPEAKRLVEACLGENGLSAVTTAQELMGVAQSLIKRGGFIELVGRSLKVQALLAGARV